MSETKEILENKEEVVTEEVTVDVEAVTAAEEVTESTVQAKLISPKQMKMIVAVVVLAIIGLVGMVMFSGASVSSAQGTWVLKQVESAEETLTGDELDAAYGGAVIYNLYDGGQLVIEMIGQEFTGEWTQSGDKVELHYNGGVTELQHLDNVMTMGDAEITYTMVQE